MKNEFITRSEAAMEAFKDSELARKTYLILDSKNHKAMGIPSLASHHQLGIFPSDQDGYHAWLKTGHLGYHQYNANAEVNESLSLFEPYFYALVSAFSRHITIPKFAFMVYRKVEDSYSYGVLKEDLTEGGKYQTDNVNEGIKDNVDALQDAKNSYLHHLKAVLSAYNPKLCTLSDNELLSTCFAIYENNDFKKLVCTDVDQLADMVDHRLEEHIDHLSVIKEKLVLRLE